jgi:hypothetical protein
LEQKRLRHVNEDWSEAGDLEAKSYETTVSHDTDTTGNDQLDRNKRNLAGFKDVATPAVDYAKNTKKRKEFRKLEV